MLKISMASQAEEGDGVFIDLCLFFKKKKKTLCDANGFRCTTNQPKRAI